MQHGMDGSHPLLLYLRKHLVHWQSVSCSSVETSLYMHMCKLRVHMLQCLKCINTL